MSAARERGPRRGGPALASHQNLDGKGRRGERKVELCADPDLLLILRRGDVQDAEVMLREEADFPAC